MELPFLLRFYDAKIINMETQTKQKGGKREGAGRKKTTEKRIMFGASTEVLGILEGIEGNKSEFINKAILAYSNNK